MLMFGKGAFLRWLLMTLGELSLDKDWSYLQQSTIRINQAMEAGAGWCGRWYNDVKNNYKLLSWNISAIKSIRADQENKLN